ncbi:MAG: 50S ribosomal protein L17 [Bacteroidota bacterium]
MRHGKKFNHLKRKAGHRKALMKNLACALIEHKRIKTTLAKAKALRKYIEPLVTKAKSGTVHNRRVAFSYLQNKEAIKELFGDVVEKVGDRPGGYTRVIKLGFRRSDGAEMAIIEFVDYNETYSAPKGEDTDNNRRRRRTRRGGSSAAAAAVVTESVEELEATAEEEIEEITEEVKEITDDIAEEEATLEETEEEKKEE